MLINPHIAKLVAAERAETLRQQGASVRCEPRLGWRHRRRRRARPVRPWGEVRGPMCPTPSTLIRQPRPEPRGLQEREISR